MARCLYTLCSKRLVFSRHACVECRRRRIKVPRAVGARRDLRSAAGHLHSAIAVLPLARRIPLGAVGSLRHHIHWVTVDNSPSIQQSGLGGLERRSGK
jgi:hypothetical protein